MDSRRFGKVRSRALGAAGVLALAALWGGGELFSADLRPGAKGDPVAALAATLSAACKHDEANFASHLTGQTAAQFAKLPENQRSMFMARLVLLNAAGSALLSSGADGSTIVRCQAGGVVTQMRLRGSQAQENLASVTVDAPTGDQNVDHAVRFGMVRESGEWKLISVGLLYLDLPAMAEQWVEEDLLAREAAAVASLRKLAEAVEIYRQGFDKLPESLEQLGPAPPEGASPERSNLVEEELAAGEKGGYRFRYVIIPAPAGTEASERDKAARFSLAAVPLVYGKSGRRSFYLDSEGTLRGADKRGEVATARDPRIPDPRM